MLIQPESYELQVAAKTAESAGNSLTLSAGDGFGTDQNGGIVYINGGRSTGNGWGEIYFQLPIPSGPGTTPNDPQTIVHLGYDGLSMHQKYIFFYPWVSDPTVMVETQGDQDFDGTALTVKGGNAGTGGTGNHKGGDLVLRGGDSYGTDMSAGEVHVHTGQATGSADGGGFKIFMPLQHGLPSGTDPVPEENFVWFSGDHGLTFYGGDNYIMNGSANPDGTGARMAIAAGSGNGVDMPGGALDLEAGTATGVGEEGPIRFNLGKGNGDGTRETIVWINGPDASLTVLRQSDAYQPKLQLMRAREGDTDLQSGDRVGYLRWLGKINGGYSEFGRIMTFFDTSAGIMQFDVATDTLGNTVPMLYLDGTSQNINTSTGVPVVAVKSSDDATSNSFRFYKSRATTPDVQNLDSIGSVKWDAYINGAYTYDLAGIEGLYMGNGTTKVADINFMATDNTETLGIAMQVSGYWKNVFINWDLIGTSGLIVNRLSSDTASPIYYTERSRDAGADVQADDQLGGLVINGMISGTQQQFARVLGEYDGTGGVLSLQAASDSSGTMEVGLVVEGTVGIIRQRFDTYFRGILNIKPDPAADTSTGITTSIPNNALTFSRGDVVYVDSSGYAALADATDNTTNPAIGVVLNDVTIADTLVQVSLHGVMDLTTLAPAWTPGGMVYLAVGGGMTQTPPAATGNMVQILGVALSANKLYCKPELVMVEAL